MAAELIFWISISLVVYAYAGYPLIIVILSTIFSKEVSKANIEPTVSFVISAFNEEKTIGKKLRNTFAIDYPREKMEIVVASDESLDATDEIVKSYENNEYDIPVILHRVEGRQGKTVAQNSAIKVCSGNIVIFSDAASMYSPGAIRAIVRNYNDSEVGAVSGMYHYTDDKGTSAGKATKIFWYFENFIKKRQSLIRTITGCSGCIYSVRKKLYQELPPTIISDLVEPLTILQKGYRIIFEPDALALEDPAGDTMQEFRMRIRVIVRGMNGMLFMKHLFNPIRYPYVAFQLISHKILRWMVSVFTLSIFFTNILLLGKWWFYNLLFASQVLFYALAISGYFLEKIGIHKKLFFLPLYFCTVNLATLVSMYKIIKKENIVTWQTIR